VKTVGIGLIRLYRRLFAWRPSVCRYEPTCSVYTEQAIANTAVSRELDGNASNRSLHPWESRWLRPSSLA